MKVQTLCLAAAGSLALAAQSANAADWGYGGGVRQIVPVPAVAVPAPVPIPEYRPSWYFRLDAGIGTGSAPDVSESGYRYGDIVNGDNGYPGTTGPVLQSIDPTWFSSDFSNLATFGAGVGYYLGGGWRLDGTIEKRSNDQVQVSGTETWEAYRNTVGGYTNDFPINGTPDRLSTITVNDRTDVDGTVWLGNMYYDLAGRGGFTPYLGLGLGFVWHQFDRTHTTTLTSCDNEAGCLTQDPEDTFTNSTSADKVSFAAAAMAGFSYDISDITAIDIGYRYLFLGGADVVLDINGTPSKLSIGDQHVHQVRAGLRFNVN